MVRFHTLRVYDDATVTADATPGELSIKGVTRLSMFGRATLGGTTPSFSAQVQTKDADGNWHNVGSAQTITATGSFKELNIQGPFAGGNAFRVNVDVDVADANETYTAVDLEIVFEYDPTA